MNKKPRDGIGYGNEKQFISRLHHYGITGQELEQAIDFLETEE